jgi:hypothetical protein
MRQIIHSGAGVRPEPAGPAQALRVAGRSRAGPGGEVQLGLRAELLRRIERDQAARRNDDADAVDAVDEEICRG